MNSYTKSWILTILIASGNLFLTPEKAQAGYPTMDITNLIPNLSTAASAAGNYATDAMHTVTSALDRAEDWIEQQMQTGILGSVLSLNELMQVIQDDINRAAGTVADIASIPSNIMDDIFGMIGSVKDTFMSAAGVMGVWDDLQGVFTGIGDVESFASNGASRAEDLLDFGDFKNAHGAYRAMRGVQTRVAIEQLKAVPQERKTVEKIVNTFDNSSNAAEIAKGNAQINAIAAKEVARSSELAAVDAQRQVSESMARDAAAASRASAQQAAAADAMLNSLD